MIQGLSFRFDVLSLIFVVEHQSLEKLARDKFVSTGTGVHCITFIISTLNNFVMLTISIDGPNLRS